MSDDTISASFDTMYSIDVNIRNSLDKVDVIIYWYNKNEI